MVLLEFGRGGSVNYKNLSGSRLRAFGEHGHHAGAPSGVGDGAVIRGMVVVQVDVAVIQPTHRVGDLIVKTPSQSPVERMRSWTNCGAYEFQPLVIDSACVPGQTL